MFLARNCASSCYFWKTKIEMSAHVYPMLKVSTLQIISLQKVCKTWLFHNENSYWWDHTQNKMSSLVKQTLPPRSLAFAWQQIIVLGRLSLYIVVVHTHFWIGIMKRKSITLPHQLHYTITQPGPLQLPSVLREENIENWKGYRAVQLIFVFTIFFRYSHCT